MVYRGDWVFGCKGGEGIRALETDLFVKATESHQYLLVIRGRVKQAYLFPKRCGWGEFVRGNVALKRGQRISLRS